MILTRAEGRLLVARRRRGAAWLACCAALALPACGGPEPAVSVAPPLEPPPPAPGSLTEEQVLELSRSSSGPEEAIRRIDSRPLAFPLDQEHLDGLGRAGIDPDVLDYLRRRARIDWETLRGDIPDPGPRDPGPGD